MTAWIYRLQSDKIMNKTGCHHVTAWIYRLSHDHITEWIHRLSADDSMNIQTATSSDETMNIQSTAIGKHEYTGYQQTQWHNEGSRKTTPRIRLQAFSLTHQYFPEKNVFVFRFYSSGAPGPTSVTYCPSVVQGVRVEGRAGCMAYMAEKRLVK